MITYKPIIAYGITWGRWKKDCPAGISDLAEKPTPKIIDKKITLSSSSTLLKTVSGLLDFLPNTETTKVLKRIRNKLPKGTFTGTIYIGPFAKANPCLGSSPPMRLIWAGVVFHAKGSFSVTAAGQTSKGTFEIFENLAGAMQEVCLCNTKKISYREAEHTLEEAQTALQNINNTINNQALFTSTNTSTDTPLLNTTINNAVESCY